VRGDEFLLLRPVAPVVGEVLGDERQPHPQLGVVAGGEDHGVAAGEVVHPARVVEVEEVAGGEQDAVEAEMVQVSRLGAEGQPAYRRVQPVGAEFAGARRCLEEKGWARTTVRDIAAAMAAANAQESSPARRYEALWSQVSISIAENRNLWLADLEAMVQAEHSPELRDQLVAGQREGRRGLAAAFTGHDEDGIADREVRTVGSVQIALLLGVMAQWLNDPEGAPSGAELLAGLRAIVAHFDE
jgi:hypothetical protein